MTKRRLLLITICAGVIIGLAVTGYTLGRAEIASDAEVRAAREAGRDQAFALAQKATAAEALRRGRRRGRKAGRETGVSRGQSAGAREGKAVAAELAAEALAEQEAAEEAAAPEPVVCDGAIADDAHYAACLEQSGSAVPPGFPGGPPGCATTPPYPLEGPCARTP